MVLADLIVRHAPNIAIATLDTGRLPAETYELLARAERHFKRRIEVFFPQAAAVEQYVRYNGINGFFESVTQRKSCCEVRKVEPLSRALAGKRAWITGMRVTRRPPAPGCRNRPGRGSRAHQVQSADRLVAGRHLGLCAREQRAPTTRCTTRATQHRLCAVHRAVKPGEDVRAGRWWWESPEQKECGLHVSFHRRPSRSASNPRPEHKRQIAQPSSHMKPVEP